MPYTPILSATMHVFIDRQTDSSMMPVVDSV